MDSIGERAEIANAYEDISQYGKNLQASLAEGQTDIFGMMGESETPSLKIKQCPPTAASQKLKWEKQYLGLYVSGHPLQGLKSYLKQKGKLIENFELKTVGKGYKN